MKILITIAMMLCTLTGVHAITAEQVLAKVSTALTSPASVSVTFGFSGSGGSGSGTMTVCRNRFTYNAGDLAVWFNGKTQWALQRSVKEVSVTEPTASELMESNPFNVVTGYQNHYTCKLLTAPAGQYKVSLTAKSRTATVKSAVITVNSGTFIPMSIEATMSGGAKTTVTVKSFTKGKALPQSYFEFNPKMNPEIEVVDLR